LAKYALSLPETGDLFGKKVRPDLDRLFRQLPPQTRFATERLREELDFVERQIKALERRMEEVFQETPVVRLLWSLPGVGRILAVVIATEVGQIERFPDASRLASYAGTTPRVHASGGKSRFGRLRPDVNRYLKWAFVEAANVIAIQALRWPHRHAARLYRRVKERRGHPKAVGAVARHLAEATYWMLTKNEPYREPVSRAVSSTAG
jgi:transposase